MEGVRTAAGFEGLIVLGVIYFILNVISEAAKKKGKSTVAPREAPAEPSPTQHEALSLERILADIERVTKAGPPVAERSPASAGPRSVPPPRPRPTQPARAPLPPRRPGPAPRKSKPLGDPHRGPLGRTPDRSIPEAEDVEERGSLEGESLEVTESLEILDETRLRPPRRIEDQDDVAEQVAQRRVKQAEQRNQPHRAADHVAFHDQIAQGEIGGAAAAGQAAAAASRRQQLRQAVVWREILGPPRGEEP